MKYSKEYYRDASKRHYRKMNGLPYKPTVLQIERAKKNRNRWYAIYSLLVDWQDKQYQAKDFAKELGYSSDCQLYMFLKRKGDMLMAKYGGLPRVSTPSKVLKKYMEGENIEL